MIGGQNKFVLGSASPRRSLLLHETGIDFRKLVSNTPEIPHPHLTRGEIAVSLAEEKAEMLKTQIRPDEILITADTIVWIDKMMLGKPKDDIEAFKILKQLNGNKHFVFTGICLIKNGKKKIFQVESKVTFCRVDDDVLKEYINIYKPLDKAGSYGAQETLRRGFNPCSSKELDFMKSIGKEDLFERTMPIENKKPIQLIDHIEGSYFNVMGLPVAELFTELNNFAG